MSIMAGHTQPKYFEVAYWTGFDTADFQQQLLANAQLIAAAPDLLEAAKRTLDSIGCLDPTTIKKQLKQAIAKAEGTA